MGIEAIIADTQVETDIDGFIGTDNEKAAEQAGRRMCALTKAAGKLTGHVLIESSVAGVQVLQSREAGFRTGLRDCPGLRVIGPRYNNNDINTAASQVNDAITADPLLVGVFAANNTSGVGTARAIEDNNAADRIPVVSFDTDPQQVAALKSGAIDTLVVQTRTFSATSAPTSKGHGLRRHHPDRTLPPGGGARG